MLLPQMTVNSLLNFTEHSWCGLVCFA